MRRARLLALIFVGAALFCMIALRHSFSQSSGLRRLTNTTEEGINLNPSISGDGRVVAFESTEDVAGAGGSDHFRAIRANVEVEPASLFQIAGSRAVTPAISQDGSCIAFASKDDPLGTNPDGNSEIFLFDGAKLIQITKTSPVSLADRVTQGNFQPSISDDGRFIAFSSNRDLTGQNSDGNLEIFVYDVTDTTLVQLTNSSGVVGNSDAKISGDGSAVAFIRDNGVTASSGRDLLKQPRVGTASPTILAANVQSLAMTYGRAISDDGLRVVYAAQTATNTTQVFLYDGRTGGLNRQITSLGPRVTEVPLHPTISGDGSRIAFAARRSVSSAATNSDGGVELYVYDLPTSAFSKITNAPASATAEVVSSLNDDGTILAFSFPRVLSGAVTNSGTENNSEIYTTAPPARPANGNLTAILNHASFGHEPSSIKAVAPDSIAVAQGTNLASTTLQSQRLPNGSFPTNVAGTSVTVNGRSAQVFFVSPTQVIFLAPPQTEIGTAEVVVTNAENFPSRGTVPTLRAAPGVFTKTGDGIGEGQILNSDTLQEGPFDPTGGNLRLSIFATGPRNATQTVLSIGGRLINVDSVIAATDMPGLDEVHVRVPADLRGVGTVNLSVISDGRESNPVAITFLGDPSRAILVNEVLADPPDGIAGDANHDGVRDGTQDEFVELVNGSISETIGIGGWTIRTRATGSTTETARFTFPVATSLPAGQAILVFGGGGAAFNPNDEVFGCAQVFKISSSAGLSLTNTGLTILIRDAAGNLITQFSYGGSTGLDGNASQSLTRSPDITGSFVLHTSAPNTNGRKFSPGLKTDGTPFGNCPGRLTSVSISPPAATVVVGQISQFNAQALDQYGRIMTGVAITFAIDNTTTAVVDSVSTNAGTATETVRAKNPGTAHLTASATDGGTTVTSTQSTLTVTGPSLSINDVTLSEGNSGTTFTFTVSLSTPAPAPVTFDIATQDNTATVADNDYVARSLTSQTIPTGQQTYSFDVTVNGDTKLEQNESFFVNVTNVIGASVADGQGVGAILSDDIPGLSINDVSASEGNSGGTTFTFTVSSTMPAPAPGITFDIATANGTAIAGSDYVARSLTTQTIPTGQATYTFDVTVNGDTLVEPNETFLVNISNASANATIANSQGVGTIQNDDAAGLVISQIYPGGGLSNASFTNDYIELFNRGTTTVDFSLTPYSAQFLSVSASAWVKTDLTTGIVAPGHYFLIRETSGGAVGASPPTADATGTINLTSTTAGKVALVSGTTLLTGNCPGDDGSQPFNPLGGTIADFVAYGSNASTANHCYEGSGASSFTLSNNTIADFRKAGGCTDSNDNAADFLTASPFPRNSASPANNCAGGTAPSLSINDLTVAEGNSGTTTATFTVSLSSAAQGADVSFDIATGNGTATTANNDYVAKSLTNQIIPAGQTTYAFTVTIKGDTAVEPDEPFFVNVTNVNGASVSDGQGQGTIQNDDVPSLSIDDVSANEGNSGTTTFTFAVSLSAPAINPVTFDIATQDGTATTANNDYVARSLTGQTIGAGQSTYIFTVTVNGDAGIEPDEKFLVSLTNVTGATIADGQGLGTIQNDDSPALSIDDVTLPEGDTGPAAFTFTVTLAPTSSDIVTVNYATADGTAVAPGDYTAIPSTQVTFAPGESTKQVTVRVNGDKLVEPNETLTVNLSGANNAGIGKATGTGMITNDDTPNLVISQLYGGGNNSGAHFQKDFIEIFNRGTTIVDFAVTPYSLQYASVGSNFGGASASAKTNLNTGSIAPGKYFLVQESGGTNNGAALPTADATGSIPLAATSGKVALVIGTNALAASSCPGDDGSPAFNPSDPTIADFVGYGSAATNTGQCYEGPGPARAPSNTTADFRRAGGCTDTNDNAANLFVTTPAPRNSASPANDCAGSAIPSLSMNDVALTEGNSGTTIATFTVSLSAAAKGADVTFDIATANGSATTANSDYVAHSLTGQIIPAGQTTYTFTVTVNGDTAVEPDETFFVNVTNVSGANVIDGQGLGTIRNDDLPALSIDDVSVSEGNSGTKLFTFHVTLNAISNAAVTFDIATQDNSATVANNDYVAHSLTGQSIPAGSTAYNFDVTVNGDSSIEPNESFFVNVNSVSGATVADGQGVGTILNDDSPTLAINDVSIAEGNAGASTATFTVTLTPAVTQAVTVGYATAPNTATAGSDYQSTNNTLTVNVGETSKQVNVTINGDTLVEPDETFFVNLTNATGGATIGDPQGIGTIQNDDAANLVISQIYPGGGLTSATFQNDFVELFNRGATTIDFAVTPYSVQFLSTSGSTWAKTDLASGTIPPGRYFLIKEASGGANGAALPAADVTGSINLTSTTAGKVALVVGLTLLTGNCPGDDGSQPFNPAGGVIADFAGYLGNSSTANHCYEGPGPASFTSGNNTISEYRKAGGCTDANDNAADFFTSTPAPRNSISAVNNCAGGAIPNLSINDVTVTEGNSGTTTATFTVSLSAPAQGTDVSFDVSTQDNTATTANNDYVAVPTTTHLIPAAQTSTTVTVNVNGDTNVEQDETFLVNVTNVWGASATDGQGLGTIQHDDLPSLSIDDVSTTEGDAGTKTFAFHVTLSAPAPAAVTFDIATADGTATTADNDYVGQSLTGQTIAQGTSSFTINVTVNGDQNLEPSETFLVNVTNVSGATVLDGQGEGTIQNDDSPVLSINDVTLSEGNSGTTNFQFTVTSSRPAPAGGITFDIATSDGTAQDHNPASEDNDYVARSLTAQTIPVGQTTYTFAVTVNGDKLVEGNETFNVNVTNVSGGGASIGDGAGVGTILNDDTPQLVISQLYGGGNNSGATFQNDFVEVFNRGTTTVNFAVTPYSIQYASAAGSFSGSASNFMALNSGTLIPGQYFLVKLAGGTTNGVALPTEDASNASLNMSSTDGKVALVFGTSVATTTVGCPTGVTVADLLGYGSANCSETAATGSLGVSKSALRRTDGCTDTDNNANDFTTPTLSSGTPPRNSASVINDCNAPPTLTIDNVTATEGNSSTKIFTFTVSLSKPALAGGVTFDIATQDDSATAGSDYVANSLTGQTIAAGQQTYTFNVTVNGDSAVEPDEIFFVNVTNVTGATVADGQGLGTIVNDDTPSLSINDVTANEGNSSTTTFNFTVTLSPASNQTVTVNYATADGTATAPGDYAAIASTQLTFLAGETMKPVSVIVNGDGTIEPDETFTVSLSGATNANISDSQGVGTITNDDGATVLISQVYAGGGNTSAQYTNDFVEIFNRTGTAIDVSNWSIQTATGTGTTWTVTRLCPVSQTCTIGANKYYLVQLASGGGVGVALPTPDATGTPNLAVSGAKVALVTSTNALSGSAAGTAPFGGPTCPNANLGSVVDFVGFGSATCFEGSAAAAALTNTTAALRASSGCTDTNANSTDFGAAAPTPRNSASLIHTCP